jgi:hypothetical protein
MNVFPNVTWDDWEIIPRINIYRDAPGFCGEQNIVGLALGWGPFEIAFETK